MNKPTSELNTTVLLDKENFIEIFKVTGINTRILFLLLICCIFEIIGIIAAFNNNMAMAIAFITSGMSLYLLRYMRDTWHVSIMLEQVYPHKEMDYTIRYKYQFNNDGIDVTISHRYKNEQKELHINYRDIKKLIYSKNYTILRTKDNTFLYFERDSKAEHYFSKKFNKRRFNEE